MTEFLRNTDAFTWGMESDPRLRSTIVTLILLDRPPDWTELSERLELLSRTVSIFRKRVVPSPSPAPPRWELDPRFDLSFHLRRVSAAAPGSIDTLLEMARVAAMSDFDRARPLWEITVVDGLADGGAALLCKLHHALTDGVGAIAMAMTLFDPTEQYRQRPMPEAPESVAPGPLADYRNLLSYEAGQAASVLTGSVKAAPNAIVSVIRHPLRTITDTLSTAASIYRTVRPISRPGSPIVRNRTLERGLAIHRVPKEALHEAGAVGGGSLNDAFIAAVIGGLRRYHEKHDAPVERLIASMPISLRTATDPVAGNRLTLMRFALPAAISDPALRIRAIHELTGKMRTERSLAHTQPIAGALNAMPRWYVGSVLRNVDFVASDVPGLPIPVYLAGAAVRMQYAFGPTIGAGVNVTLLSYVDSCAIGINVDTGAIPDFDVFYDCLVAGFDEVLALAE